MEREVFHLGGIVTIGTCYTISLVVLGVIAVFTREIVTFSMLDSTAQVT